MTLAGCGGGVDNDPTGFVGGADMPHPRDYPIHGIDVSKYQGDVDWSAVADSGVKFAWIKATEGGDRVDPQIEANWVAGAGAVGIPRGAYHFVYWCRSPLEEIKWFEQNVPAEADALPPVLDVEPTPDSRTCRRTLDPTQTVADITRHAGGNGALFRQEADRLHLGRLLRKISSPGGRSPTTRCGCARPSTTPRCVTARKPG